MIVWRRVWLPILALVLWPAAGAAAELPRTTLAQAFRAAGQYTIPAAWAGVWSEVDTTYECGTLAFLGASTGLDTLCTGQSFEPDSSSEFSYSCSGTVTDTNVDLTCTANFDFGGCAVTFQQHILVTRTGETATSRTTQQITYVPTMCAFQPDSCRIYVTHMTRVEPAQPACATPAKTGTWGALKTRYR